MPLSIDVTLDYAFMSPADCLVQIEAANLPDQRILSANLDTGGYAPRRSPAEDGVGERLWTHAYSQLRWRYTAEIEVTRDLPRMDSLYADTPASLPSGVVKYLFPSRFCPSDKFLSFVSAEFGQYAGGAQISAMRDWIEKSFTYVPGSSDAETSALETFVLRQGVCRDYAHMLITLARAAAIPARIVSVYAPGVVPQDFHAVAEVWLNGAWHMQDPTGMARPDEMARICVGRDATDIAFLTSYGFAELREQSVQVTRV